MVESISGAGSATKTIETDNFQSNSQTVNKTKNGFANTSIVNNLQGAQEKTLFNQADVTRTTLAAKAQSIPKMNAASEARLAEVNPQLANRIRSMAADLKAQGINVMVVSGYRSFAEQNALYAQGRTKPGGIVTNAKGGQSLHNYGLAVDVVPLDANGQPNWNVPNSTWQKIGAAGKKQGLEWGGDWKSFVDRPHFQMTAGRSISSLLSQYNSNGGNLQKIWNDVNKSYPTVGQNTPIPPTTPTTPTGNNLKVGSRGASVTQLQQDLTKLGYKLSADGVFGPKTDAAVKKFQKDHNLTVDGIVGPKTRAAISKAKDALTPALPVPTATLKKGSKGEQVKQLQNALVKLGFMTQAQMNTGPGTFGPKTDSALRAFQRSKGLAVDGIYGPKSQAALRKALGGTTSPTSPTPPANPGNLIKVPGSENVSAAFKSKLVDISKRLGVNPNYLMAVMSFESKINPKAVNSLSNATGLIQFLPSTARGLGTSVSALKGMSAERQLDFVEKYLKPYKGRMNTIEDAYMAVFYPASIGKSNSSTLFSRGSTAYSQNSGLDINKDGVVTKGEAASIVRRIYENASR